MKNKSATSIYRDEFIVIILYLLLILCTLVLPGGLSAIISIITVIVIAGIASGGSKVNRDTTSLLLVLPVIMSCLQNVYLGATAEKQTSMSLQISLSCHFLLLLIFFLVNIKKIQRYDSKVLLLVILIFFDSIFLCIVHPSNPIAFISSFRNIISMMLFFAFSMELSKNFSEKKYYQLICYVAWLVILFGLFEYIRGLGVWQSLGITRLWELKGIATNSIGIPPNWYSSESFGGNIIRRMVSSFADPVNLGTFLFAILVIAWYQKKKWLQIFTLLCILLTVSKGAFLGVLIFIIVYTASKKNTKILVPVVGLCVLIIGLYFISFSSKSSSGSVFVHINGFLSSFYVLASNPIGLGLGNVGVLSGLFNTSLKNFSVSETGIGMIIAQLGIPGLIIFIIFFIHLMVLGKKRITVDIRKKTLYYSLLFGFIANAMFNEVALSPNSCGLYFIQLAVLINSSEVIQGKG